MATTKEIRISQLPLEKDIRGMMTVGVNSANQSVKIPIGEVINEEISKVKRAYGYSRIDALTVESSADDVATALIADNENKRTMPNVGDVLVDWGGVTRVPVVKQTVQTGGEKPIYSFSFRTADNTATKTVKIQGFLYEPQTVVSVETVKDVTQQQISTLDTQLAEEATARLNQDDVLEAKITEEKNARIAKDDVVFTVTKDTINDAETVGDANWAWALIPSVSDEELNARIAKRANFYVDVSLDTLGFLPYLKFIKLESIPENKDGVFSALIPPASEFGYVEATNIKVKYNAKHKRWIALFYGAEYIIPTATADANGLMSKEDKVKLDTKVATKEDIAKERTAREEADKVLTANLAKEVTDRTNAVNAEATAREQADTAINEELNEYKSQKITTVIGSAFAKDKAINAVNGNMVNLVGAYSTDFIPVIPGETVYLNAKLSGQKGVAGYNQNKTFNCNLVSAGHSGSKYQVTIAKDFEIVIPNDVFYIKASTEDNENNPVSVTYQRTLVDSAKYNSIDIQGIKDKGTLHDLFLTAGATYNDATKKYQLNGLDLTFEEIVQCFVFSYPLSFSNSWSSIIHGTNIRTNFPLISRHNFYFWVDADSCFLSNNSLEVVNLDMRGWRAKLKITSSMFMNCKKLRVVKNIDLKNNTERKRMFEGCSSLEDVDIINLNGDLDIKDSPRLNKTSIVNLINHATPSSPITITLHPTAYAMATADPEIQAELEKQPNISLAEGEPSA